MIYQIFAIAVMIYLIYLVFEKGNYTKMIFVASLVIGIFSALFSVLNEVGFVTNLKFAAMALLPTAFLLIAVALLKGFEAKKIFNFYILFSIFIYIIVGFFEREVWLVPFFIIFTAIAFLSAFVFGILWLQTRKVSAILFSLSTIAFTMGGISITFSIGRWIFYSLEVLAFILVVLAFRKK